MHIKKDTAKIKDRVILKVKIRSCGELRGRAFQGQCLKAGPNTGLSGYRLTVVKFEKKLRTNFANFTTVGGSKVF